MKKYSAIRDMYYGNRGGYDTIKIKNEEISKEWRFSLPLNLGCCVYTPSTKPFTIILEKK